MAESVYDGFSRPVGYLSLILLFRKELSLWRRRKLKGGRGTDPVGVSDGNERIMRFPEGE
jgi:hypothetical protein